MLSGKEALAGGYRLAHVKQAKRYLFLIEIVILVLASILVVFASGALSLKPFYLPINAFLYFVLIMVLVMAVEGFVFKILEMRLTRSDSTNYYVTKNAIRAGVVVVGVSALVIVLLWTPFIAQGIESTFNSNAVLLNDHSSAPDTYVAYYDRDPLGLSAVDSVTITAQGGVARVYIVSESNFLANSGTVTALAPYRINTQTYVIDGTADISMNPLPYGKYYVVLDTSQSTATSISTTVHTAISPTFLSYVPLMAILFIVAYGAWIVYLIPMRSRYGANAIYR